MPDVDTTLVIEGILGKSGVSLNPERYTSLSWKAVISHGGTIKITIGQASFAFLEMLTVAND